MGLSTEFPAKCRELFNPWRYKVLHGGRGSAKSWSIARALLITAASKPTRILCTREVQKSIKASVHQLLKDQIQSMGLPGFSVLETEIRHVNGSAFLFAGLSDLTAESIKSYEGIDICWVEEAHAVTARSWTILTPTIRKSGSEIWISLNPELDTDETYVRFVSNPPEGAWVQQLNWRDNPWFGSVLEAERQDTLRRDPDGYANIWEGEPRRVAVGAIYAKEVEALYSEGRIRPLPHDPILVVDTVWDLGWNDAMTIGVYQRSSSDIRMLAYIEDTHKTYAEYITMLEKMSGGKWRWGKDFLPHDARAKSPIAGKSAEDLLKEMGRNVEILPALDVESGIKAARLLFPRLFIDEGKPDDRQPDGTLKGTQRFLECVKRYRRTIPTATGEPGAPLHDEFSHGADMFRYTGMAVEKMGTRPTAKIDLSNYGSAFG